MRPEFWNQVKWRPQERLLIYGIGNTSRQDDGLGIRFIERIERHFPLPADIQSGYQLNIEDALLISNYGVVVFVDATVTANASVPYALKPVAPAAEISFSTHAMSPQSVLSLCEELYGQRPRAFLLAIPGYEWGIREELSARASSNLERTCADFLEARYA